MHKKCCWVLFFFKSLFRDIWNRWLDSPGPFYLSKFLSEVKALNGVLSVFLAEMCETLHQNLTWLRNHSHLANAISAEFPHVSYFQRTTNRIWLYIIPSKPDATLHSYDSPRKATHLPQSLQSSSYAENLIFHFSQPPQECRWNFDNRWAMALKGKWKVLVFTPKHSIMFYGTGA